MFTSFEHLADSKACIYDAQRAESCSYASFHERVCAVAPIFSATGKALILLLCDNSLMSLTAYAAALRSGHAVMLASSTTHPGFIRNYVEAYRPDWIVCTSGVIPPSTTYFAGPSVHGVSTFISASPSRSAVHPDLALLLLTSGSTGSPKAVRLSYANLDANAKSICEYLRLDNTETAITTLPMSYSYGMSVINSHLQAGASLVLTNWSIATSPFWHLFRQRQCTSLAGVPFTYEVLEKLRFTKLSLPSLRMLTQAGGRMSKERTTLFAQFARERGVRFYIMYGQTEASPRISYVPPDRLLDKIGSIGIAIPRGRLTVELFDQEGSSSDGELIYEGPNVMLGYARDQNDLAKGDELHGYLRTGDIGRQDEDGFFYVTGRQKRFIKLYGLRINLDEVETLVESEFGRPAACIGTDDALTIVVSSSGLDEAAAKRRLAQICSLHPSVLRLRQTDTLPTLESGKKDYAAITSNFG